MENLHAHLDCSIVTPHYYVNAEENMNATCAPRRKQLLETFFPICSELNPKEVTTPTVQIQSRTFEATTIPPAKCGYDVFGLPDVHMRFMECPMKIGFLPINAPIRTLQFDGSSQSYLKRFIMMDHSGGKGRAYLHPALGQELSAFAPHLSSELEHVDHVDSSNASRMMDDVFGATLDERLMAYKETFASNSAALQYMKVSRMSAMAEGKIHGKLLDAEIESMSRISDVEENGRADVDDSDSCVAGEKDAVHWEADSPYWHEDTDDIDALLSSDDEVSSAGYFPDDCFPVVPSLPESNLQKKRRTSSMGKETSVNASVSDLKTSYVSALADAVGTYQNTTCSNREITEESRNSYGCISGQRTSARNARKRKIKTTVQRLRKIIPGGDRMEEAVVVLDEVISYVKSLQQKVQQLETSRNRKVGVDKHQLETCA